jgi:hypothetical protein
MTPSNQLALFHWTLSTTLVVTLAACGGGGGEATPPATTLGIAPSVPPRVILSDVPQSKINYLGAADPLLRFVAPGRGLLAIDSRNFCMTFDVNGQLRRGWNPPAGTSTFLISKAVGAGGLYILDPTAGSIVRLDPSTTSPMEWLIPAPTGESWVESYVFGDNAGHVYLTTEQRIGDVSSRRLSRLSETGTPSWTVGADNAFQFGIKGVQRNGVLVEAEQTDKGTGLITSVYSSLDQNGEPLWQVSLDGAMSGAYKSTVRASVDGGAYGLWNTSAFADTISLQGAREGLYTISTAGVVRSFDTALLGEQLDLVSVESAYPYLGLPTQRHFFARGSEGSLFHLRQTTSGALGVRRLQFGLQQVTQVHVQAEPASGDLLARVQTASGLHLVRMAADGSLRWSKDVSSYAVIGDVFPLPDGGALFAVQALNEPSTHFLALRPTGVVSFTLYAPDLKGALSSGLRSARLSDGGIALAYGRRLLTVGPSSELRAWVEMSQDLGEILDIVGGTAKSIILVGQSTGQPSAAFWTVDVTGSSNAPCLMMPTFQDYDSFSAPPSAVTVLDMTLAPVDDVFQVTTPQVIQRLPLVQLTPTTRWSSMELTTADPCTVSAASAR